MGGTVRSIDRCNEGGTCLQRTCSVVGNRHVNKSLAIQVAKCVFEYSYFVSDCTSPCHVHSVSLHWRISSSHKGLCIPKKRHALTEPFLKHYCIWHMGGNLVSQLRFGEHLSGFPMCVPSLYLLLGPHTCYQWSVVWKRNPSLSREGWRSQNIKA